MINKLSDNYVRNKILAITEGEAISTSTKKSIKIGGNTTCSAYYQKEFIYPLIHPRCFLITYNVDEGDYCKWRWGGLPVFYDANIVSANEYNHSLETLNCEFGYWLVQLELFNNNLLNHWIISERTRII